MTLKAPFPWFGGKSRVQAIVWERFGDVPNYVEPFAGSLAVLLGRPHDPKLETVNDLNGFIANFWRALAHDPSYVAKWADWPVNEADLHARHIWLLERKYPLTDHLMADPDYYDAKIAGWWVWGICSWIGSGWCAGSGSWTNVDGLFRKRPHLGTTGQGVRRQLPHLGTTGQGVHRQLPHLGDNGKGVIEWFEALQARLRRVRVCCGDWTRFCGRSVTWKHGATGVFLDPPYQADTGRDMRCYQQEDSGTVAADVAAWAREQGDNPLMRIALCGYEGEHDLPGWDCVAWKAAGGYGGQSSSHDNPNAARERIWFSPHCLDQRQGVLI